MTFFNLWFGDTLITILASEQELDESDINDIQELAYEAYNEADEEIDETIDVLIRKCKEHLNIDVINCSASYDITL